MKRLLKTFFLVGVMATSLFFRIEASASTSITIEGNPGVTIEQVSPGEDGKVSIELLPNEGAGIVDIEMNGESIKGGVELPPGDYTITGVDKDGNRHDYNMTVDQSSEVTSSSTEWREEWSTEWSTEWYEEYFSVTPGPVPEPDCPACPEEEEDPFEEELEPPASDEPESPQNPESTPGNVAAVDKLPQTGGLDGRMAGYGAVLAILLVGLVAVIIGIKGSKDK